MQGENAPLMPWEITVMKSIMQRHWDATTDEYKARIEKQTLTEYELAKSKASVVPKTPETPEDYHE